MANHKVVEGHNPDLALNELQVLLRVEKVDGTPVPSFLFTEETIKEMCLMMVGFPPVTVEVLGVCEALLTYEDGMCITTSVIEMCKNQIWYGFKVDITGHVSDGPTMAKVYGIKGAMARDAHTNGSNTQNLFNPTAANPSNINVTELTDDIMGRVDMHVGRQVDRLENMLRDSRQALREEFYEGNHQRQPPAQDVVINNKNTKPSKISYFSGGEPGKGEVSYDQWSYEVMLLKKSC